MALRYPALSAADDAEGDAVWKLRAALATPPLFGAAAAAMAATWFAESPADRPVWALTGFTACAFAVAILAARRTDWPADVRASAVAYPLVGPAFLCIQLGAGQGALLAAAAGCFFGAIVLELLLRRRFSGPRQTPRNPG